MMRFDYLHSSRPLPLRRMLETRVPARLHSALFALGASVAIVGGGLGIDGYRLQQARRVESAYRQRFEQTERALKQTNLYYGRVRSLVELDRRVRSIASSGDADARTLAEIANHLPRHAWLTGISHDATGLSLDGRAKDLRVLSGVMHGLMHARSVQRPRLISAILDKEPGRAPALKYEIHIDGAAP